MPADSPQDDACDVRFGQVGLANVRVLDTDPAHLRDALSRRVAAAPALFERTAVVVDLSHVSQLPDDDGVRALIEAVRGAGMLPVGLAYGSSAMQALGERLGMPLIARFREAYERGGEPARAPAPSGAASASPAATDDAPTLIHTRQVRSGQQIYAQQRDLVVTATVANGAEIIADGSIHVYGSLRGRALAGAQGQEQARIFCTDFRAQLVSIAGHYRVFEEVPEQYDGQTVQCWLEDDKLRIVTL